MKFTVLVSEAAINVGSRHERFNEQLGEQECAGAVSSFVGLVRGTSQQGSKIDSLYIEHYPAMTEKQLTGFARDIAGRLDLQAIDIAHRCDRLRVGEVIVHVLVAANRRKEAIEACSWLVEKLKNEAPFWKKECGAEGERWVSPETH